jgi:DNA-binding Lrp family transcriptional regulator
MDELDVIDEKVLEALTQDSRATVREIAKKINAPITTVHNRLRKLRKGGVIKRFTIEPDYEKLGKGILVFVYASIDHEKLVESAHGLNMLKKKLHSFPEIKKIYAVTGDVDIVMLVRVGSIKELDAFLIRKLRNIKGITNTTTQIVLEEG